MRTSIAALIGLGAFAATLGFLFAPPPPVPVPPPEYPFPMIPGIVILVTLAAIAVIAWMMPRH